jgi:hypothetical protein
MGDPATHITEAAELLPMPVTTVNDMSSACSYYGMTSSSSAPFYSSVTFQHQQNAPLPGMASFYSRDSSPFITLSGKVSIFTRIRL